MNKKWLALILMLQNPLAQACYPRTDGEAAMCVAGLGISFVTLPVAGLDYLISKASGGNRLIPSDKQVEFIVGAPIAFAATFYLLSKIPSHREKTAFQVAPFVTDHASVGITVYKQF